jgi:hypothetical protein
MIISLFFIFVGLIFLFLFDKDEKNHLLAVCFILVIVAGMRPIGIDKDSALYANFLHEPLNFFSKEPSFYLISKFSGLLLFKERIFFLSYAIIGVGLKFYAIKRNESTYMMCIITYFSIYFILHEMTQIRAGVASGFFLISIRNLSKSKIKKYMLYNLIGMTFHYSAIIYIIYGLFHTKYYNRIIYALLPICGIIFYISDLSIVPFLKIIKEYLPFFIEGKIDQYLAIIKLKSNFNNQIHILNFFYTSCVVMNIIFAHVLDLSNKYEIQLSKLLSVGLFFFYFFATIPVFAFRISELFFVSLIFLIPILNSKFSPRSIVNTISLCWLSIYFFFTVSNNLKL